MEEDQKMQRFLSFRSRAGPAALLMLWHEQGGFVQIGGSSWKCLYCGVVISDWQDTDGVIQRHREASPNCAYGLSIPSAPPSAQGPSIGGGRSPTAEDVAREKQVSCALPPSQRPPTVVDALFLQRLKASEEARLETFYDWPLEFLSPRRLAKAGFYYLHDGDRVCCAFCRGGVHGWEPGDDPLREHARHYPCCPFLLNRGLDGEHANRGHNLLREPVAVLSKPKTGLMVHTKHPAQASPVAVLSKPNTGLIVHTKHPAQASPDARMRSFEMWPSTSPKRPQELVEAGFFYTGQKDRIVCFHCGVTLGSWDESDDPWKEHARWFPRCEFVAMCKGKDFIKQCLQGHRSHLNSDYDVADAHPLLCKIAEGSFQQRLRTFLNWPLQASVPKEQLAEGGFEHIGGLRTQCRSCDLVISDWQDGDSVIQRHRDASPHCSLVQSLQSDPLSSAIAAPSVGAAEGAAGTRQVDHAQNDLFIQRLKASGEAQNNASLPWLMTSEFFLQPLKTSEEARLATFSDWPAHFLPPQELAQAGFYYISETATVHCAFCRGVVHGTKRGDDPLRDHARDNPLCPFLLNHETASGDDNSGQNVLGTLISELPKLNISLHLDPKHPEQASPDARMHSFEKWPSTSPKKPVELVEAGFFYIGLQDYTTCFQCDRGLCNWEASDDPWEEHACRFPRCQFVLLNKGEAYVLQCLQRRRSPLNSDATSTSARSSDERDGINTELAFLMRSEYVKLYLSQGVPVETLRTALVDHMRNQSRGFASPEELSHILDAILLRPRSSNGPTAVGQSSPSGNAIRPPEPNAIPQKPLACRVAAVAKGGASSGLPLEPSDLAEENLRLKEQWLCKVCLDAEVGVLFLPCGHLVACPACASALTSCAVCRREILGMVRTFHS
ncbi:death-associated inhibitor of apoptosis 2-like [Haemaphysalis longicornis]